MSDEIWTKEWEINELKLKIETSGEKLTGNISILEDSISGYKMKIAELERRESELVNEREKNQALWEGKYKFLEEWNDQLKKDLTESS